MTLALIIALAGLAGSAQDSVEQPQAAASTGSVRLEVPTLTWPPLQSINLSGLPSLVRGLKIGATTTTRADTTLPICTMRVVPADPDVDRGIARPAPAEVDQRMVVNSRCAEQPLE